VSSAQPRTRNAAGRRENIVQQVSWGLDLLQRLQPLPAGDSVREQRSADKHRPVHVLRRSVCGSRSAGRQSLTEQGLELAALDPVFGFAWHHITCLYVR